MREVDSGEATEAATVGAATELRKKFRDTYGRDPDVVWAAPGRVNLIGEHTDYNDGFVLPMALPQRVVVAAARRDDMVLRLSSAQQPGPPGVIGVDQLSPGTVTGWMRYVAGIVWVLRQCGHPVGGIDLFVDGQVPAGAGLSSSAALECAVATALCDLFQVALDQVAIARLAQRAENEFVGVPCGVMDQMASMLCTEAHALFLDTRTFAVEQVPVNLRAHGLVLLVIDTRAPHALVEGAYAERRRSCEQAASELGVRALRDLTNVDLATALKSLGDDVARRRVRHVVTENARVLDTVRLLREHRPLDIGPLLTASHASLRDDYEVSCLELDTAVMAALAAGAYGARMTGGGFGGSAIALADFDAGSRIIEAVTAAFASQGFGPPQIMAAVPSGGAQPG